jgi:hypothetical protein
VKELPQPEQHVQGVCARLLAAHAMLMLARGQPKMTKEGDTYYEPLSARQLLDLGKLLEKLPQEKIDAIDEHGDLVRSLEMAGVIDPNSGAFMTPGEMDELVHPEGVWKNRHQIA